MVVGAVRARQRGRPAVVSTGAVLLGDGEDYQHMDPCTGSENPRAALVPHLHLRSSGPGAGTDATGVPMHCYHTHGKSTCRSGRGRWCSVPLGALLPLVY